MSTTHKTQSSVEMLNTARECFLQHPEGLRDQELADLLSVSKMTAFRYRKMLNTVQVSDGVHQYKPTQQEIVLARAILIAAGE